MTDAEAWLETVYAWPNKDDFGSEQDLMMMIADHLEELVEDSRGVRGALMRPDASEIIAKLDLNKISISVMLWFVTMTHGSFCMGGGLVGIHPHKLEGWDDFYARVKAHLQVVAPDRWERLLPTWKD